MDGNVTGQWMQHFVLRKLVLFTVLLTEEAYCLRKMKELRKQRLSHHHHTIDLVTQDWLTVSTNSNFFLSWTSWMRQTYSSAALAKSLCSISRVASALKRVNINKSNLKALREGSYKFNCTKSFLTSSWWQWSRHSPIQNSLIFCAIGLGSRHCFVFMADSGLSLRQDHWAAEASSWPLVLVSIAICQWQAQCTAAIQYSNKCTVLYISLASPTYNDDKRKRPPEYQTDTKSVLTYNKTLCVMFEPKSRSYQFVHQQRNMRTQCKYFV